LFLVPLAACVSTTSFSTSGPRGGDANGQVTIPNVFKLPKEQAIAALRRAGVQGDIVEDSSLCGSVVEGRIIERGEVCYQHPPGGRVQGARLVVSLRVQSEDPRHGNIGKVNEWRLMPKLVGLTYERALAEMRRAGFESDDRVQHVWADEPTCKPNIVCRQYPEPMERAGLADGKVVYVGQDRSVKPTGGDKPPTGTTGGVAEAPRTPTAPTPTPTPTGGTGERKLWGGDGTPAYRDAANVPRGPGGPVFMGKGQPCTNKLDHCLRPGVWFATDGVVAGKLFRGTPVFELDGKWWTWRGQPAEYKHLFRTKLADKAADVSVGKPIVFFVEEGGRKWLDNEMEMLTSSRWSVGVVESVDGEAIRIKGWSNVSLESVRVIVEEKSASGAATPSASPGDLF
jgi:hypothetical protein